MNKKETSSAKIKNYQLKIKKFPPSGSKVIRKKVRICCNLKIRILN